MGYCLLVTCTDTDVLNAITKCFSLSTICDIGIQDKVAKSYEIIAASKFAFNLWHGLQSISPQVYFQIIQMIWVNNLAYSTFVWFFLPTKATRYHLMGYWFAAYMCHKLNRCIIIYSKMFLKYENYIPVLLDW